MTEITTAHQQYVQVVCMLWNSYQFYLVTKTLNVNIEQNVEVYSTLQFSSSQIGCNVLLFRFFRQTTIHILTVFML